jgi:Kef-type K+ transport system membrane component KefB
MVGIGLAFWVTQLNILKPLKFSSYGFIIVGIILSSTFNLQPEKFETLFQLCFAFIAFYAGFTFRISDFRLNEPITYKITLFDVILSVSLFLLTFLLIQTYLDGSFKTIELSEVTLISIACSTSSIGLIRFVNQTTKHSSNKARIAFDAVSFQQFLLLFLFTFSLFLSKNFHDKNDFVWMFLSLLVFTVLFQLYVKHSKNEFSYLVILISLGIVAFVLIYLHISPYFFMLLIGLFIANSLQSYEELLKKYSETKEYVIYTMLLICGMLILINLYTLLIAIGLILSRFIFKVISQRLASVLIADPEKESVSYSAFFLSHGRLSIILAGALFFITGNIVYQYLMTIFAVSVLFFEYLGQAKYKRLLLSSKLAKTKVSQ